MTALMIVIACLAGAASSAFVASVMCLLRGELFGSAVATTIGGAATFCLVLAVLYLMAEVAAMVEGVTP